MPLGKGRGGALPWDPRAEAALGRVPFFVRPLVRRKVEERVAASGGRRVGLEDFQEAEAAFRAVSAGKSQKELKAMLPVDNRPGVEMVVVEACRSRLSNCPNPLIDTQKWLERVRAWVEELDLSERLRRRVAEDKILFHHKLKIAIAGCPNGCSRPQIADLALVGMTRPRLVEPEACTACGACAEACPDGAVKQDHGPPEFYRGLCQGCLACSRACPVGGIELDPPGVRVLMAGKLGRHPHLARPVMETHDPAEVFSYWTRELEEYLASAPSGRRFSAWWLERHPAD